MLHHCVGKPLSKSAAIREQVLAESGGTVEGLLQLKKETQANMSRGKCSLDDQRKLKAVNKLYRKAVKAEEEGKASASVVEQEDAASNFVQHTTYRNSGNFGVKNYSGAKFLC